MTPVTCLLRNTRSCIANNNACNAVIHNTLKATVEKIIWSNSLGLAAHSIDLFGGVALFSIYNAYDTHVLIEDFEKGKRDYIYHAVNYSLNAINIFIRMLEIVAKTVNAIKSND